jgi:REP element-mobilizing transposase RayT
MFVPGVVYEITSRTLQERFLLRPSEKVRDVIHGILERGRQHYRVRVHAYHYMSNHCHLLISADTPLQFYGFLSYVNGLVARKVGPMNGWRGLVWGGRARIIPILDDVALVARLRYIMAQGVKEGLVASVLDWPGASATPGLLGDMKLRGTWVDQDALRAARRRCPRTSAKEFTSHPVLELSPLPCWNHLSPDELRARHRELADEIEEEARVARKGAPILGVAAVLAMSPLACPPSSQHSRAPACHTASERIGRRFEGIYRAFVASFREEAKKATAFVERAPSSSSDPAVPRFPAGSMPRPRWTVPPDPRVLTDIVMDLLPSGQDVHSTA